MNSFLANIPMTARSLLALGDRTTEAAQRVFSSQGALLQVDDDPDYSELARAFGDRRWKDEHCAAVSKEFERGGAFRPPATRCARRGVTMAAGSAAHYHPAREACRVG